MIEQEAFDRYVREALAHIYDQQHLKSHPLASLLTPPGQEPGAAPLHRVLFAAIEEAKPAPHTPRSLATWRRYRHLRLRYVEGLDLEEVADDLGISTRQARRDHLEAMQVLVAILWDSYRRLENMRRTAPEPGAEGCEPRAGDEGKLTDLDTEIVRLGSAPPDGLTDVAEVSRSARATVASLADTLGVRIALRFAPGLPPAAVNRTVLRQALVAMLTYAIEHYPGACIEVAGVDGQQWLSIRMEVIAPDSAAPSAEVGSVTPLATARRLVELQAGVLDVAQESGSLVLYVRVPPAQATTVLVIEDNPDTVRLFQHYLQDAAYRVLEANNGERALRLAQKARPRGIILDVMMPYRGGWEILQGLKNHPVTREIPVVVCSVLDERALAISLGAADFLPKPVTQNALLTVLQRWAPAAEVRREWPSGTSAPRLNAARPDAAR